jgi:Cu(I)/Ag(I) efflux system membrane fusion protein
LTSVPNKRSHTRSTLAAYDDKTRLNVRNPLESEWWQGFYTRHHRKLWLGQALVLLAVGFGIAWSQKTTPSIAAVDDPHAEHADAPTIWTCAMHPQIRRDGPGDCPICGMELVPVKPSKGGMRTISISPTARKLMNIQTTPVERRYVTAEVRMVGKVEYDETRLAHITAWVSGRLDKMYVDYTGVEVKKGNHMVYIYSEELYAAQEELIQALKFKRERTPGTTTRIEPIDLVESSREKLRLLGLTSDQIKEIEQRKKPSDHVTLYSPISGIVIQKLRQEGDRVRTGDRIYTVADLNQVWVKLDAYESDLSWLRYGQSVSFTTDAYPGETFTGKISFIAPVLNKQTRTVKVRVNVPNEDGRLKPEMFVRAVVRSRVAAGGRVLDASLAGKWISPMHPEIVKDEPGKCDICGMPLVRAETLGYVVAEPDEKSKPLVIPVSAALVTGKRAIVYVEVPTAKEPTFEGREIVLGPRAGDYYLVRNGLKEGDLVVTNGNFKLDSALQISAKPSMMTPEGGGGGGHDHGGGTKSKQGESAAKKMPLPAQFRLQLEQLVAAYDNVTAAIKEADLEKIHASLNGVGRALAEVDEKLLTGHAASLWREFSMLLSNDVVEGRDVTMLQDADRVYLVLKRHIQRVREQFGLTHDGDEPEVVKLDVPAEFQTQLGSLWKAYLPMQNALTSDNLQLAKQGIEKFGAALATIDAKLLKGDTAKAWTREQANLTKIASDLKKSSDITGARSAFALLSDEMFVLVRSFGVGDVGKIYELHCPMAFEGRGAIWLQDSKQTRNPYYGATMLKCADRVKLISPPQDTQPPTDPHAGNDHKH